MRRRVLFGTALCLLLAAGGVTAWQLAVLQPVETGRIVTCSDCGSVVTNQVCVVRVPFWVRGQVAVERQHGLCQACAQRPITATVSQTIYCATCGTAVRTVAVSATLPRQAYDDWIKSHQSAWGECGYHRSARLVARGQQLTSRGEYAEAGRCYLDAITAYPEGTDARRFLDSLRSTKAQEVALAEREARAAEKARIAAAARDFRIAEAAREASAVYPQIPLYPLREIFGVSLMQFESLRRGMTLQQVEARIGPGTLLSETGDTVMYTWDGRGTLGANMNAMFQNGRLVSKAQFGLE